MAIQPPMPLESPTPESPGPQEERQLYTPGVGHRALPDLDKDTTPVSPTHWWIWLLIFALIGYGCYRLYKFETAKKATLGSLRGMARPRSIPVVASAVRLGDMPVYLEGFGTVTAFNTVTVKPQVDGPLISVNFTEGPVQSTRAICLRNIDPRPFQVAARSGQGNLAQAKGNLAKDRPLSRDAQANYMRDQELFKQNIIANNN